MLIRDYVLRIFIFAAIMASSLTAADMSRVAGTKVSIKPPSNFTASSQFTGFRNEETNSSIMITEIPGPIAEVGAGINAENFSTRGMTLLKEQSVKANNMDARLLHVRQYLGSVEYLKWMLIFGNESASVLVIGSYPASLDQNLGNSIKESVLTASWNLDADVGYFDGLDFRINETSELKIVKRMSNLLIIAKEGSFGKPGAGRPVVLAGNASAQPGNDISITSKQILYQSSTLESISIIKEKNIRIGNLNAYEIVADALDAKEKLPLKIYQVVIEYQSSVYVVQGRVKSSDSDSYLSQFSDIANSFTLTRE